LSYGFNEIGCFCLAGNPPGTSWNMQSPTPPFKATLAPRPAQLLCITEISGSDNPGDCDGNPGPGSGNADTYCGDAAWLDGVWGSTTYGNTAVDSENGRLQTAYAKHDNRMNVLYVDGHNETTLVSKLTWGVFFGSYGNPPQWPELPAPWNASISETPLFDSQVWSTVQE
jgi:prepilin-type processing-associated H-X9-DG protein